MRRCPVRKCGNVIETKNAMCKSHWRMVPKPMRDEIWGAYKRRDRASSISLILAACRDIERKERELETGESYAS